MNHKELEEKVAKLEAENAALREAKNLLAGRTALAWVNMTSSVWRHSVDKFALTMREQVNLLRQEFQSKIDLERINKRLAMIERLANQILDKPISSPLSSDEGSELISMTDLIHERISQLKEQEPYSNIEMKLLEPSDPATVRISREWFNRGLDLLIDNSVEAMVNSQNKRLAIKVVVINKQINIAVEDTGHGIPSNLIPLLFVQSIPRKETERGMGLGLLMAQMIFQTYGGDLQLTHTGSQGTIFTIFLPQAD